jgi:hypothetical protein
VYASIQCALFLIQPILEIFPYRSFLMTTQCSMGLWHNLLNARLLRDFRYCWYFVIKKLNGTMNNFMQIPFQACIFSGDCILWSCMVGSSCLQSGLSLGMGLFGEKSIWALIHCLETRQSPRHTCSHARTWDWISLWQPVVGNSEDWRPWRALTVNGEPWRSSSGWKWGSYFHK